eukprot:scaffold245812_cov24-Prasinocladus_malaysianus.AAC.1
MAKGRNSPYCPGKKHPTESFGSQIHCTTEWNQAKYPAAHCKLKEGSTGDLDTCLDLAHIKSCVLVY